MPIGVLFLFFGLVILLISRLIRRVDFEAALNDSNVMGIVSALLILSAIILIVTT
jgi:hypothetical protein